MLSELSIVIQSAIAEAHALSAFELVAVLLALAYIFLVLRESLWCWPAAFLSTAIYTWLFWEVALLMESVLNVYYMFMAGYGYWAWRNASASSEKSIESWPIKRHIFLITATTGLSLLAGYCMANFTQADFPWLDAATTCFAIVTTWLVAQKILENWLYWIVIDAASIYLYLNKGFMLTSVLFMVYIGIAVAGYFSWTRTYQHDLRAR
ncbi:nicotinamide riboside transporter PnuC [Simiduia curdlanivorans]|uniref:Nicotinamide riboside transporter PnuC n=1 Tax=Simiduia curdlanivorans TaxID=1492769 RepID=A0ABV8V8D6_9GAMM|nr:nicotinamide riboside transporter PnuC [Simiduia curdlanivorans]MDN3638664.1 nicotinamide riboside transporter PnuC [Simiduia curdlanivorans]